MTRRYAQPRPTPKPTDQTGLRAVVEKRHRELADVRAEAAEQIAQALERRAKSIKGASDSATEIRTTYEVGARVARSMFPPSEPTA